MNINKRDVVIFLLTFVIFALGWEMAEDIIEKITDSRFTITATSFVAGVALSSIFELLLRKYHIKR